jgi:hypothetical protein
MEAEAEAETLTVAVAEAAETKTCFQYPETFWGARRSREEAWRRLEGV